MAETFVALLAGIRRFSADDGTGVRTMVLFKGCPLSCRWCPDPEIAGWEPEVFCSGKRCLLCGTCVERCPEKAILPEEGGIWIDRRKCTGCGECVAVCSWEALRMVGRRRELGEVMSVIEKDREVYGSKGGVTLSGGEVLGQPDFACELARRCVAREILVTVETSGYGAWEDLLELAELAQYILFRIKSVDDEGYRKLTGVSGAVIWDNLQKLAAIPEMRSKITIGFPVMSRLRDDLDDVRKICLRMKEWGLDKAELVPCDPVGISEKPWWDSERDGRQTPGKERLREIQELCGTLGIRASVRKKEAGEGILSAVVGRKEARNWKDML